MELVSSEWLAHQHRDTLSSVVGHPTLTSFLAIADGEAIGRVKFEMTEVRWRVLVVGALIKFVSSVCSNRVGLLRRKTTIKDTFVTMYVAVVINESDACQDGPE